MMDSERTKRLMLECERELEEARKAEREDWLFSIIGSVCAISIYFLIAQVAQ
ncbi:MAG: hypothetical protein ACPHIB_00930 [Thalassobaculaceae bacterium]